MKKSNSFKVHYDANTDVLYITAKIAEAVRGVEDGRGIVWRFDSHGCVISATIMDFQDLWSAQPEVLALELSNHFHIPRPQAQVVVDHALEDMPK